MDWCICSLIKEDGRYQGRFGRWFLADGGPERLLVKMCLFGIILVYNTEIGKGNPLILCNFAYL